MPYDQLAFGPSVEECEYAGDHSMDEAYRHPIEFAQGELEQAVKGIAWVCHDRLGHDLEGLRIELWSSPSSDGDPAVLIAASDHDLAAARLAVCAGDVRAAVSELANTRRRLRHKIIGANQCGPGELGRNHITTAVTGAITRRLVLETPSRHMIS